MNFDANKRDARKGIRNERAHENRQVNRRADWKRKRVIVASGRETYPWQDKQNRLILTARKSGSPLRRNASCRSNSMKENAKTDKGKVSGTQDTCRAVSIAADTTGLTTGEQDKIVFLFREFYSQEKRRNKMKIESNLGERIIFLEFSKHRWDLYEREKCFLIVAYLAYKN